MIPIKCFDGFASDLGKIVRFDMDERQFVGSDFNCACGSSHRYGPSINTICQGSFKLVVSCPDDSNLLTCIKMKMFLKVKFKHFESLSGYRMDSAEDKIATMYALKKNPR